MLGRDIHCGRIGYGRCKRRYLFTCTPKSLDSLLLVHGKQAHIDGMCMQYVKRCRGIPNPRLSQSIPCCIREMLLDSITLDGQKAQRRRRPMFRSKNLVQIRGAPTESMRDMWSRTNDAQKRGEVQLVINRQTMRKVSLQK